MLGVSRRPASSEQFAFRSVDVTDARALHGAIADHRPDVVLHTVAMTDPDACEKDPRAANTINVQGTRLVARAAESVGAHLIHVSTDYVFDGSSGPYSEEDRPRPVGVYAQTKLESEISARELASSCAIARTAVVYGHPPSARPNFGTWLYEKLSRQERVTLFRDQWVSPTWADSVAAMLLELAERKLSGTWNLCGGEVVSRVKFGEIFCEVFGFDPKLIDPILLADSGLTAKRPPRAGLIADKARRELTHKPLSIREALQGFRKSIEVSR